MDLLKYKYCLLLVLVISSMVQAFAYDNVYSCCEVDNLQHSIKYEAIQEVGVSIKTVNDIIANTDSEYQSLDYKDQLYFNKKIELLQTQNNMTCVSSTVKSVNNWGLMIVSMRDRDYSDNFVYKELWLPINASDKFVIYEYKPQINEVLEPYTQLKGVLDDHLFHLTV